MALSTLAKEQENFLRYAILIVDHSKTALTDLLELNLKNKHLTFEEFLNQNQHEIYHLCYDSRCCQCKGSPIKQKRIIYPSQLELLFDKHKKLPCHIAARCNDFCCSYAKLGVTTDVLDLTLARCLLVNCCLEVFWFSCLTFQCQTLEQFLNLNKHTIYHLWRNSQPCCQCQPGFIYPCDYSVMTTTEWNNTFKTMLVPCASDRKRSTAGSTTFCTFAAKPGIALKDIDIQIQGIILKYCCPTRKDVECLGEHRNKDYGHIKKASLSDVDFNNFFNETEDCLLNIARLCGKELEVKDVIRHLRIRPVDATLCSCYQNTLLETIYRNESTSENVKSEHLKTRKKVSCKLRKLEDRIESLEMSSIEIKEEVQGLRKLIKDFSIRSQLMHQTSSEIESHRKCGSYIEINAVKQCIQILKKTNVVILSGREACGKSRNGLEILRQLKEAHEDFEVFKLYELNSVSKILKCNVISIVLLEFANIESTYQLSDKLELLYSYTSQNKVKIIFVMRNTVKHKCKHLLSNHKFFRDSMDIDLTSEQFMLTTKEKENILINYCSINKISIVDLDENVTSKSRILNDDTGRETQESMQSLSADASVVLRKDMLTKILQTDPFCGFPECCVLFTDNKNKYFLDDTCFKWPSRVLINDIEKLRMEGKDNYTKALMYVILIYLLSLGKPKNKVEYFYHPKRICLLAKDITETQPYQELFNACYPMMNNEIHIPDIIYGYEELVGRYLVDKDGTYYFQHQAVYDSILISYSKIYPRVTIPLLGFEHMIDLVRLQNYTEQKDEIVIRISRPYYSDLAKHVTSLLNYFTCCMYEVNYWKRMMECKIFTENDINLIYQFVLSSKRYSNCHCVNLLPLYLLSNIGKLDDKTLTVNHTQHEMLITAVIDDTNITISVDPTLALIYAFQEKYENIIKWLLQNTYHTFIDFKSIMSDECVCSNVENVKLLLQNVNHDKIDMTMVFELVCLSDGQELDNVHALNWMIENVNQSLIDYNKFVEDNIEYISYAVIDYLLKKTNKKWFDINEVVQSCFREKRSDIFKSMLNDVDFKLFDKEKILDTIIATHWEFNDYQDICDPAVQYFIKLMFGDTSVKYMNINRFVDAAIKEEYYSFLQLLLEYDSEHLINTDNVLEFAFQISDSVLLFGVVEVIVKTKLCCIDVQTIFEKAFEVGMYNVVSFLLKKVENLSIYFTNKLVMLNKLLPRIRYEESFILKESCEDVLLFLLQGIDEKCIDIESVMNDVCQGGYSKAVLWLLETKPSCRFNMRNVMNKSCVHGKVEVVEYLFKTYGADYFDYNSAMIKACRNEGWDTLCLCRWLWKKIDHSVFNMKAVLNNACRYQNDLAVKWILKDVDTGLYDIEVAVLCATEHGNERTLQLLLNQSSINMIDIQSALMLSCRNERSCLCIAKLLYGRADKSTLDINAVLSNACNFYRSDLVQWIIKTCFQRTTETNDGNKNCIKSLDKNLVDMDRALTCILNMDAPDQKKKNENETKRQLVWLILKQCDSKAIYIYELLTESCKKDWVDIFQWILEKVDNSSLNIGEVVYVACQNGAFNIVKWSLENIDMQLLDADNVMIESCASGWLECLVLVQKHCNQHKLHAAMVEACTYGRLDIVKWLLQNFNYQCFNLLLLLRETGRNGWTHIFFWLVTNFHFCNCHLQITTHEALVNGNQIILKLMFLIFGRDAFDLSTFSNEEFADLKTENVVNFILRHFDPRCLDLATIMTNACKFGWKNIAAFIIDNDSNCLFDSALSLIDTSSFITRKHVSCLCDFTSAFNTACDNGEAEIVQLFIVNVSHKIFAVQKAMLSVCIKGWDEIAILLLDSFKHTRLDIGNALIEACRHGEIDVVQAIFRKVKLNLLDVKTALNGACENHMHEELVLWILENTDLEQLDLKNVKIKAVRHRWRKVLFAMAEVDTEDLNQVEQETETDYIVIL